MINIQKRTRRKNKSFIYKTRKEIKNLYFEKKRMNYIKYKLKKGNSFDCATSAVLFLDSTLLIY